MDAVNLAAIISAAILGSSHCIGMCGGFVIALSGYKTDKNTALRTQLFFHFIYHLGRISSYALLGAVFGFLGHVVSLSTKMQGFLWFAVGCFMMALGVSLMGRAKFLTYMESSFVLKPAVKNIYNFLKASKKLPSFYLLGIFNGFLPCGLVYFFLASALKSGSVSGGILIMAIFGLCTLPSLLILALTANFFIKIEKLRDIMIKITGVIVTAYGIYISYLGYLAAIVKE
ncbi:MAG: sulfite exporter TauE/SafE family protein [Campylobacteraceae bacterium]|jgi:sulfite exporter TauE/SafE|nr:sulfite exporter TauE/SafE family protein [Campylobacteraceae bacterium]